ncbi:nucleotide exchange factor GrpE [Propionibacterium sp.]|uniref:nucleotide exchange factor GrpE n=1 Tax=Propionibacterium sp. TaxID=1977903 RepID=UPI0039E9DD5E
MTDKPAEASAAGNPGGRPSVDAEALDPDDVATGTAAGAAEGDAAGQPSDPVADLKTLVAERTSDLQRLQAEYVNYKKRVDRDRDQARNQGVEQVVRDLMPVFDAIEQADAHGELTGGFKLVADELGRLATKHGLILYGEPGEEFDPRRHEALMQVPVPGTGDMLVHEVMQKGVELNDSVVRPARVVVSVPNGEEAPAENGSADEQAG